ncbi:hypothetical protein PGTUg99_001243 [Puccinia graminis f. sp. tritici]|uniref:Uncharacterized protein n=1 Tax=Puccinia graminis f. sp. tritici TaxID=56615 RepID=A0A5B0NP75_PUCGR|nr:hypothetical protein PGTUg99_001262 [Puccinia graminis f. sp. tritici]KAA1103646.1 hypothetical protein PGTUg99_001243 [Puccinia graminis f. sp. tritici]
MSPSPSKRRSISSSHPTTPKNNKNGSRSTSKSISTNLDSPRSRTPKKKKQIPGQLTIDEMFKAHKFKQSTRAQSCTSPEKEAPNLAEHGSEKAEMVTLRRSKSQSNIPALASSSIRGLPNKSGITPQNQSEPNRARMTSLVVSTPHSICREI